MPFFNDANVIGLSGEYLAGAVISRELRWPYRMQPIADLGIDGEIEVLGEEGRSTGRLIKVQCKADEAADEKTRYVKREHFEYWMDLALPVIVVHPRLHDMEVRWSPLSKGRRMDSSVAFDVSSAEVLSSKSAVKIADLAKKKSEQFDPSLGMVHRLLGNLRQLDYTPIHKLDYPANLILFGKMKKRWQLIQDLAVEAPEIFSARSAAELRGLGELVGQIEDKLDKVVTKRP